MSRATSDYFTTPLLKKPKGDLKMTTPPKGKIVSKPKPERPIFKEIASSYMDIIDWRSPNCSVEMSNIRDYENYAEWLFEYIGCMTDGIGVSCGLAQFYDLGYATPKEQAQALLYAMLLQHSNNGHGRNIEQLIDEDWLGECGNESYGILFSDVEGGRGFRETKELSIKSPAITNPNTGNEIVVYIFTKDQLIPLFNSKK
jgi:hypothetical protein